MCASKQSSALRSIAIDYCQSFTALKKPMRKDLEQVHAKDTEQTLVVRERFYWRDLRLMWVCGEARWRCQGRAGTDADNDKSANKRGWEDALRESEEEAEESRGDDGPGHSQ